MTYYLLQLLKGVQTTLTVNRIDEPIMSNLNGSLKFDNSNEFELYEREEKFIQCGGVIATFVSNLVKKDSKIMHEPIIGVEIDQDSSIHLSRYINLQ